jgi:hypothetical protein
VPQRKGLVSLACLPSDGSAVTYGDLGRVLATVVFGVSFGLVKEIAGPGPVSRAGPVEGIGGRLVVALSAG